MPKKAFVLLSGGLDSTTCLHKALFDYRPEGYSENDIHCLIEMCNNPPYEHQSQYSRGDITKGDWVEAVSIDYGQRHIKEASYALKTCKRLGIKHTVLSIKGLNQEGTMLTDKNVAIPDISYSEIKGVSPTYVPFRNGSMLSRLTAYAQQWVNNVNGHGLQTKPEHGPSPEAGIYFGAHSEDAQNWAYPDCTPEFIGAMANAIYIGTYRAIRLHTPLQWLMKSEIVRLGERLNVKFEDTWSCYKGEELHCGVCPTCRSRRQAFIDSGVIDPTEYASAI